MSVHRSSDPSWPPHTAATRYCNGSFEFEFVESDAILQVVPHGESKHPLQVMNTVGSPFFVGVHDGLHQRVAHHVLLLEQAEAYKTGNKGSKLIAMSAPAFASRSPRWAIARLRPASEWHLEEYLRRSCIATDRTSRIATETAAQVIAEGVCHANFDGGSYKTNDDKWGWLQHVEISLPDGLKAQPAVERGRVIGELTNQARTFSNEPGNSLTPRAFAEHALAIGREIAPCGRGAVGVVRAEDAAADVLGCAFLGEGLHADGRGDGGDTADSGQHDRQPQQRAVVLRVRGRVRHA